MTTYSYSRLTSYHQCQYGFYLNYIRKFPAQQNVYGLLGGKVHELLEQLQVNEITNDQAIEKFKDACAEMELNEFYFPSESIARSYKKSVTHYLKHFKPYECESCEIEKEFLLEIEGVKLLGFIDLILKHDDGTVSIIDHKTSSKYAKAEKLKNGRQLVIYAIALGQLGYQVREVGWSMLKYARVKVADGRYKTVARDKIALEFFNQISAQMELLDIPTEFKGPMLEEARVSCSIDNLPEEIQDMIEINPVIVEYELTDELIDEAKAFIVNTVRDIESKSDDPDEWEPVKIDDRSSFFCGTLCNQRHNCKFYQAYKDNFQKNSIMDELREIFG